MRTGEFELKLHLRSKRKKGTRPLFQHMYCTLSDLHRCNYSDARKTVVTFWWRADNWEYRSTFPNEAALNNVEGAPRKNSGRHLKLGTRTYWLGVQNLPQSRYIKLEAEAQKPNDIPLRGTGTEQAHQTWHAQLGGPPRLSRFRSCVV